LKEAIRLNPDDARVHINPGGFLPLGEGGAPDAEGHHDDAIVEYKAAIRLQPDNALAHFSLGKALYAEGHYDV
jgi:cytochrome c-type biogenesis protein CcmH/NrfG